MATPKKKVVVRGGQRKIKWTCPKGYKVKREGPGIPRCVKMTARELRTRHRAALKAARKARTKRSIAMRKRSRSLAKRKRIVHK